MNSLAEFVSVLWLTAALSFFYIHHVKNAVKRG